MPKYNTDIDASQGIKTDATESEKAGKIAEKKKAALKTAEIAENTVTKKALDIDEAGGEVVSQPFMTDKTVQRIRGCSSWAVFATPADFGKYKKTDGFVCKCALCPVCMSYQSRRDALRLVAVLGGAEDLRSLEESLVGKLYGADFLEKDKKAKQAHASGVRYVAMTLTTVNVRGRDLAGEVKKYARDFDNFIRDYESRDKTKHNGLQFDYPQILGYVRKLEVTYNKQEKITEQMWEGAGKYNSPGKYKYMRMGLKIGSKNPDRDTYHPHYHVLLAVTPDFLRRDEKGRLRAALSEDELLARWRQATGDSRITQVKLQIIKSLREGDKVDSALMEIAKYVAKDADYLHSPEVFKVFYQALKGCKRMVFGGILRAFNRLFREKKLERYIPPDTADYKWLVRFAWAKDFYVELEKEREELTEEKAAEIRGMRYDEANDTEDF